MPKNPAPRPAAAPNVEWQSFARFLKEGGDGAVPAPAAQHGPTFHRDLSWLRFNDRVLSEAADPSVPPLERLRFATIVSSNLDEFFMVRVAEQIRLSKQYSHDRTRAAVLSQIRDHVLRQKATQAAILKDVVDVLAKLGIQISTEFGPDGDLDKEIRGMLPEMKLVVRRLSEAIPPLLSERIHVFVRFPEEYALISIEDRASRLLTLPPTNGIHRFALLERWLAARAQEFFPKRQVLEAFPFKIIRDADLRYHPDDEESLEEQIVEAVQRRLKAKVVRLEVDAPAYSEGAIFLATALGLDSGALYRFALPLDLRTLATIYNIPTLSHLRYPPVEPQIPPLVRGDRSIFETISKRDVLLHHPYDSFGVIVRFLEEAAKDPSVTRIHHTMYRTSRESPIMEALKEAVRQGKKVTAYVEIKARFDELNNVRWAEELRAAGVKVVRPLGGYKVHSKVTQVIRREDDKDISYVHLGTGNYHPGTALQYTDLGLLSRNQVIGQEVSAYFNVILQRRPNAKFNRLMVAPVNLHSQFIKLIRDETAIQRGGGKGHIIAKMNSLVDSQIIEALYEASQAGVKIKLIVRGICCLRPGVKGLSENIRVVSVIDRFLEHSRIYYFRAGGAKKTYLSSADWMPRNFYTRYEIAFPIEDPYLKRFLREVILANSLHDTVKGWILRPDGTYERAAPSGDARPMRSQFFFEALAKNGYAGTLLAERSARK